MIHILFRIFTVPCAPLLAGIIFCFSITTLAHAEGPATTISGPEHSTELWQGKVLTATFRVGMCFAPDGKARGVLMLKHANGQEDVYHLYGHMDKGHFELSHSSGHYFAGNLTGPGTMEGKAKLKNGPSLTLKGTRLQNVRLLAEDCAPLPR